jgi:hypothetical protein
MLKRFYILLIFNFAALLGFAQSVSPSLDFSKQEKKLTELGHEILNAAFEKDRYRANETFVALLEEVLTDPGSFLYSFESLQSVAKLTPPDNKFRIFNWHLPKEDGSYEYYAYIQMNPKSALKNKSKNIPGFFKLFNNKETKSPENKELGIKDWYGAHYYKIIQNKGNDSYTLLGWDGNNMYSNKKVIDVLHFSPKGEPKFGAPVFKYENKVNKRVIFEYAENNTMSLKYNEKDNMIVFDYLIPSEPILEGQYQYYVSSFSFDGFKYKKGNWIYTPDVDVKNPRSVADKKWNAPK